MTPPPEPTATTTLPDGTQRPGAPAPGEAGDVDAPAGADQPEAGRPGGWRNLVRQVAVTALVVALAVAVWPAAWGGWSSITLVSGQSMAPELHHGDLVVTWRHDTYDTGDIVVYRVPEGTPGEGNLVVHRIEGGDGTDGYVTRGDNRDRDDWWRPTDHDILGRVELEIPGGGRRLLDIASPAGLGLLAAIAVTILAWGMIHPAPDDHDRPEDDGDEAPA